MGSLGKFGLGTIFTFLGIFGLCKISIPAIDYPKRPKWTKKDPVSEYNLEYENRTLSNCEKSNPEIKSYESEMKVRDPTSKSDTVAVEK